MKRSERATVLREIASHLSTLEWPDIDFLLRTFDFPWSNEWGGDKPSYALEFLSRGNDECLTELHSHLFGESTASELSEQKLPWAPGSFRLFITHISANKSYASATKLALLRYGIDGFVAHTDIEPTREWEDEIAKALASCDALTAFLHSGFSQSKWTDQEVGFCVGRRILLIPVRFDLDPYGFIARYQAIHGTNLEPQELAAQLFNAMVAHDLTAARITSALVARFEASSTFAAAKQNVGLVKRASAWTPDLLRRIEGAVTKNNQISDAFGVPEVVRAIVEKHRS